MFVAATALTYTCNRGLPVEDQLLSLPMLYSTTTHYSLNSKVIVDKHQKGMNLWPEWLLKPPAPHRGKPAGPQRQCGLPSVRCSRKGKGFDDGLYLTSALLRKFLPRGYTHFRFTRNALADDTAEPPVHVVLRGFFKFTGAGSVEKR